MRILFICIKSLAGETPTYKEQIIRNWCIEETASKAAAVAVGIWQEQLKQLQQWRKGDQIEQSCWTLLEDRRFFLRIRFAFGIFGPFCENWAILIQNNWTFPATFYLLSLV